MRIIETLDDIIIELLMKLQYDFPLTPTPFRDVAESIDMKIDEVLGILKQLTNTGILKRIGFYYNYRSQGHVAALAAFSCKNSYEYIANLLREDPLVSHSFLRDHPIYSVWAVIKRVSKDELLKYIDYIGKIGGADKWIVLFSKRVFKLSVKFDLREGISKSGPYSMIIENPPSPEELGINPMIPKSVRSLEFVERPYLMIAFKTGLSEDEVVDLIKEMLKKGILLDPGATLNERNIGFTENAMITMEDENVSEICECVAGLPYTTHVVLREPYPPGSWTHNCYAMVHAINRNKIENTIEIIKEICKPKNILPIYSIADLKPGVIR